MRRTILFFLLASATSWTLWAPLWLPAVGVQLVPALPIQHELGAFGPFVAALALSGRSGAWRRRGLLVRMVWWGERRRWLLVALLGPLLVLGAAVIFSWAIRGTPPPALDSRAPHSPLIAFLALLATFGLGEEAGWRGFALPRLQSRYSALTATAIVTAGWAAWHLPLFLYRPAYVEMGPGALAGWLVSLVTGSVLLTWLFNESRGSILVAAVFHAAVDAAFTAEIASPAVVNAAGVLLTLWGLGVLIRAGPETLSSTGKVTASEHSLQPG